MWQERVAERGGALIWAGDADACVPVAVDEVNVGAARAGDDGSSLAAEPREAAEVSEATAISGRRKVASDGGEAE